MSLELSRGGPPPSHWIVTCHFVTQQEASVETFSTWNCFDFDEWCDGMILINAS